MHIIHIFLREWGIAGGGVREVGSGKRRMVKLRKVNEKLEIRNGE